MKYMTSSNHALAKRKLIRREKMRFSYLDNDENVVNFSRAPYNNSNEKKKEITAVENLR